MLFNSLEFALFLPAVFAIYWLLGNRNIRSQNFFLILASYFFYGWWDWRFLGLIFISSTVDYLVGLGLGRSSDRTTRRVLLLTSICVNIGFLGFFKYFNFFAENFYQAFTFLGSPVSDPILLNIVLPVGISFYTFQTLSYSIDLYNKKIETTHDPIAFFAFVSFFPQLVAGPIERAKNLLPQFHTRREFNYDIAADGMRQILWGFFKKIVIADNCAIYVNDIFANYETYSGATLVLGAFLFAFQIYGDFSGYSDIAIGTARLFGFNLMRNFAYPYFSRDIAEFWRRWHISLSSWFRDYVYIPLGGSRDTTALKIRNVFIIFLLSGFWHGANWTFLVWGALNAIYFLPLLLINKNRQHLDSVASGRILPSARELLQMGTTFSLTLVAWVFFRSESVADATAYLVKIFSVELFSMPDVFPARLLALIFLLVTVEWLQRDKQHGLCFESTKLSLPMRWACYYGLVAISFAFRGQQQEFIYFQF